MRMGRKGALVLLLMMVLWAATPALACLTPSAHRSCCQGMAMQECSSPAMMQCGDCCRVQPADAPLLPGSAGAVDHSVGYVPSPSLIALALPSLARHATMPVSEAPLPPGSPATGSILRI